MKVYRSNTFIIFALATTLLACGGTKGNKETHSATADTLKKDTLKTVAKQKKEPLTIERKYDDIARYIAGLPQKPGSTIDPELTKTKAWTSYSEPFNKSWKNYDSTRLSVMRAWSKTDLDEMNKNETNVFYPFAGADILNAYTFFPHATQFVMVGLEPVGTLPELDGKHIKDSLNTYFHNINNSLTSILNFSFFRTKSMRLDFNKQNELNGTIHLLLLFLTRTGNTIAGITPVSIHHDGSLARYESFDAMRKDSLKSKGVEIRFIDADSVIKKAYFFSTNLANDGMKANPGFSAFVKGMGHFNTYLKSASCLMHENYFSSIRNLILDGSNYVLEDDSGIPYKYFVENGHYEFIFYGTYTGAYNIFHHNDQKDLMEAYKSGKNVKPLPFGIGYKFKKGESNLMLAKHKR
ncbi:MAG TPA: hypothetical protein VGO45_04505 [Bacteroidia bacterium]|jgi:hypothetical protein|nr:hypothetical protein [Bacteroidia bacterium]